MWRVRRLADADEGVGQAPSTRPMKERAPKQSGVQKTTGRAVLIVEDEPTVGGYALLAAADMPKAPEASEAPEPEEPPAPEPKYRPPPNPERSVRARAEG